MVSFFFDVNRFFGAFYDKAGVFMGIKEIDPLYPIFDFLDHTFVYRPGCKSVLKLRNIIFVSRFYTYNYDNPEPLEHRDNAKPVLTAKQFGIFINTRKLEELNGLSKSEGIFAKILKLLKNPIFWILIAVFGFVIYWLSSHNWRLW